jgi:hypothetical protein
MTAFGINDAHTRDLDASLHAARESHRGRCSGNSTDTAQHTVTTLHHPNSHDSARNPRAKHARQWQHAGVDCTSVCPRCLRPPSGRLFCRSAGSLQGGFSYFPDHAQDARAAQHPQTEQGSKGRKAVLDLQAAHAVAAQWRPLSLPQSTQRGAGWCAGLAPTMTPGWFFLVPSPDGVWGG